MQAKTFQEVNEKVQCCMVGLLIPSEHPGFGFPSICSRGERRNSPPPNASATGALCFGVHQFDGFHSIEYQNAFTR